MIPVPLPALVEHGRPIPMLEERAKLIAVSAAAIDRISSTKVAAAGGRRRRVGFYSGIRPEVPIRTFNDLGRSASWLLRDRHGGARRHERGGLVHP